MKIVKFPYKKSHTKNDKKPDEPWKEDIPPAPHKVAQIVLERIENFPETYHQPEWTGEREQKHGTGTVASSGDGFTVGSLGGGEGKFGASDWSDCGATGCVAGHASAVAVELGLVPDYLQTQALRIPRTAERALGLTPEESSWLFHSRRTESEVKSALASIANSKRVLAVRVSRRPPQP